jgi:hypothetical protein
MDWPQFTIELTEAAAGEGLVRIPVAKMGRFVKGTLKFAITRATLADLVANFRKRQADTVIDYEHASEMPEVAAGDAVPAAGWLKTIEEVPDDSGILWGAAEFTARARKLITDKEVRYLSPAISYGAKDKSTGEAQGATLTSMAVTNRPFLEAMPAIALNDRAWAEIDRGDAVDDAATRKGKHTVKVILTDRVACKVRVVNDDGTESVLPLDGLEASPKVVKLSDLTAGSDGQYNFAMVECGDGVLIEGGVFRAQVAQNALNTAIAAGKILPAQRKFYATLALNDLAGFEAFVKDAPKVVDLTTRGTGAETLQLNDLDQVELEIHRLTKVKMTDGKTDFATATKLVLSENPTLAERKKRLVAR